MPARKPEECDMHLMEALNNGDLEAAVALYEPNATFVAEPSGAPLVGHAAIREAIRGYFALGRLQMTRETTALKSGNGDLAMTGGRWKAIATDAHGQSTIVLSGNSREVVRRQPDGTWLFVIDNPWGAGLE